MPRPNQKIDVSAVVELDEFRQVKRAKCLYKQHSVHFESPESLLCAMQCEMPTACQIGAWLAGGFYFIRGAEPITRHPFGSYAACLTPNTAQNILARLKRRPFAAGGSGAGASPPANIDQFAIDRRYGLSGRCAGVG
ncbi:MAG: hypothetical protein ACLT0Y_02085 [Christensenellales bacterium]